MGKAFTRYRSPAASEDGIEGEVVEAFEEYEGDEAQTIDKSGSRKSQCLVWEIWNRKDGLVYLVCDGYPDFLEEPAAPDVYTERFWPWFGLVLNEVDNEREIFPPSDVRLLRDMQIEINRARQGLREHRRANRPKTIVPSGMLEDEDKAKLQNHPANAVLELNGLAPGQDVGSVLQPYKGPPIDPALYDVNATYDDILRVVGVQEANLGGTSGSTATESNIAESSRMSSLASNIDDLDDMLSDMARTAGQILIANVSQETVKKTVGPGAVWPEVNKQQIAE